MCARVCCVCMSGLVTLQMWVAPLTSPVPNWWLCPFLLKEVLVPGGHDLIMALAFPYMQSWAQVGKAGKTRGEEDVHGVAGWMRRDTVSFLIVATLNLMSR
jgi:hypothetical protein